MLGLKQILNEVQIQVAELKGIDSKKFCIEAIRSSDKNVQFYTGLPCEAVFDQLLDWVQRGNIQMLYIVPQLRSGLMILKKQKQGRQNGGIQRHQLDVQPIWVRQMSC